MKDKRLVRRVLKLCIALVFAHHIACTALYLSLSNNPTPYRRYVIDYINPVFPQFWALFAEPTKEYEKVLVRCQYGDAWSDWRDPLAPLLRRYQNRRPWDSGKDLLLHVSYINSVADVLKKAGCGEKLATSDCLQKIANRPRLANGLETYAQKACPMERRPEALVFKVVTVGSVNFASRSPVQQMEAKREILFPEVSLGK